MINHKIQSFTDLVVWQKSHKFVVEMYKITKNFPKEEMFGLVSQMRRCAVSITSNIAEGFSRHTYPDKVRFYQIAKGSVTEIQNQLLIARDVGYLEEDNFKIQAEKIIEIHKLLNAFTKKAMQYK